MTLVLLLAFALGARGLNLDPIWADELSSLTVMGAFAPPYSPTQVIDSINTFSPDHAPLYFILGAYWTQAVGISQFAVRSLSLFWGVMMVVWVYRFATDSIGSRVAMLAALLMGTNIFVIIYFHDIRMYSMLMALGIMHTWLYWRMAHGCDCARITWLLFAATTTGLFYTHYFSAILFAGLGAYHLLFAEKTRRWLGIVAGWIMGGLLFAPYAPLAISGLQFNQGHTRNPLATSDVIENLALLLSNGLTLLWAPLLLLLAYSLWRHHSRAVMGLLFVTLVMFALILAIHWRFGIITFTRTRYFFILWFLATMLIAYGLVSIPYWRAATVLFVLLWCVAGYRFDSSGDAARYAGLMARDRQYPPLHQYVYHLAEKTGGTDFLLGFSKLDRVSRVSDNSPHSTSDYFLNTQLGIDGVFLHSHLKRYRLEQDVRDILKARPHVLLAHDPSDVPLNYARTLAIISEDFAPCETLVDEPNLLVRKYAHPLMDCPPPPPRNSVRQWHSFNRPRSPQ